MFRAIVFAPDHGLGQAIERFAVESRYVMVNKTLNGFPESEYETSRMVRSYEPELVLIENTSPTRALSAVAILKACAPDLAVLALGGRVSEACEQQFEGLG